MTLFLVLVFLHALGDYPLQGPFLSSAKNKFAPVSGVPWWQAMGAHAAIHGGLVGIATGSVWLGIAEFIAHAITDHAKCGDKISFNGDQAIHLSCKAVWTAIALTIL